jgi:choice-of-anchor C domain-containing protein
MLSRKIFVFSLFCLFIGSFIYFPNFAYSQIQNGSFESGTNPGSYATLTAPDSTTISNWNISSSSIDYIGTFWTAADGSRSLDLSGAVGGAGVIQQTFTTIPGATYSITFSLAGNPAGLPVIKTVQVSASPCSGCSPQNYTFDTTGSTLGTMGWVDRTYGFLATGASTTITFTSLDNTGNGPALDNVRGSYTLPPPPMPTSTGVNLHVILALGLLSIISGILIFKKYKTS